MDTSMTDRQIAVVRALNVHGPCPASTVAEQIKPGSDPRGAAQTMRRMQAYVVKTDKGWQLTSPGRALARHYSTNA